MYCGRECQRADWVQFHKAVCTDPGTAPLCAEVLRAGKGKVVVVKYGIRGRGLKTLTALAVGDEVLRDEAALLLFPFADWDLCSRLSQVLPLASLLSGRPAPPGAHDPGTVLGPHLTPDMGVAVAMLAQRFLDPCTVAKASTDVRMLVTQLAECAEGRGGNSNSMQLLVRGMLSSDKEWRDRALHDVMPGMSVAANNCFQVGTEAAERHGLACFSIAASLINHCCRSFNALVDVEGPVRQVVGEHLCKWGRVTVKAVAAVSAGEEVITVYNLPSSGSADAIRLHRDLLRSSFGIPCTCWGAGEVCSEDVLLRRIQQAGVKAAPSPDIDAWLNSLVEAGLFSFSSI